MNYKSGGNMLDIADNFCEEDDDQNYDDNEADLIPGDNSLPLCPSDVPIPMIKDAPENLNHIPAQGGEIPIVVEPLKP